MNVLNLFPFNKNLVRGQIAKSFPRTIIDKPNGFINVLLYQPSKLFSLERTASVSGFPSFVTVSLAENVVLM